MRIQIRDRASKVLVISRDVENGRPDPLSVTLIRHLPINLVWRGTETGAIVTVRLYNYVGQNALFEPPPAVQATETYDYIHWGQSTDSNTSRDRPSPGFSYSLGAFTASTVASDYVAKLSAQAPNELFVIAPVSVSGTTYYRVLGGTASSSPELERDRPRLAAAISEDGSEWVERDAQLAFTLGNHTSLESAVAPVADARLAAAHPYVHRIDHEDGSMTYRVYSGEYASSRESSVLRQFLSGSGIAAELRERRGVVVR